MWGFTFVCSLRHGLTAIFIPWKGCGAARWVLRELAMARVMALSDLLRCGCVRIPWGELSRV